VVALTAEIFNAVQDDFLDSGDPISLKSAATSLARYLALCGFSQYGTYIYRPKSLSAKQAVRLKLEDAPNVKWVGFTATRMVKFLQTIAKQIDGVDGNASEKLAVRLADIVKRYVLTSSSTHCVQIRRDFDAVYSECRKHGINTCMEYPGLDYFYQKFGAKILTIPKMARAIIWENGDDTILVDRIYSNTVVLDDIQASIAQYFACHGKKAVFQPDWTIHQRPTHKDVRAAYGCCPEEIKSLFDVARHNIPYRYSEFEWEKFASMPVPYIDSFSSMYFMRTKDGGTARVWLLLRGFRFVSNDGLALLPLNVNYMTRMQTIAMRVRDQLSYIDFQQSPNSWGLFFGNDDSYWRDYGTSCLTPNSEPQTRFWPDYKGAL
jgi:hypothetical protein